MELNKDEVRRLDTIIEDDVRKGFRVKPVPAEVQQALKEEGLTSPTFVRLSRVNPSRRRHINEEVQRRYHRDIKNPDVLSNAQVLLAVIERGEWSAEMQAKMDVLQERTTREMARLWGDGLTPETSSFANDILEVCDKYREMVEKSDKTADEKTNVLAIFDKWAAWTPGTDRPDYAGYEAATAQALLFDLSPSVEAIDLVNELEELKDKQESLVKLAEMRIELTSLQLRHARIFADTAESRRDHTEEMAQLYYTCAKCDEAGTPGGGNIAATFENLWDFPDAAIKWLLYESFLFHNDVPDAARSYLAAFGFLQAERENSENGPSAGSLAPQSSKVDGTPAEATPAESGESTQATTSMTAS